MVFDRNLLIVPNQGSFIWYMHYLIPERNNGSFTITCGKYFLFTVAATHKETKQFYTFYNTLDDTKLYLEKEVFQLFQVFHCIPLYWSINLSPFCDWHLLPLLFKRSKIYALTKQPITFLKSCMTPIVSWYIQCNTFTKTSD